MKFRKYQHVERWGTEEVEGIEKGICYIFPKIDGTNGVVYLDNIGEIRAGSRKRELTLEKDNHGFYQYVLLKDSLKNYLEKHPNHRLYGEWLVRNVIKTYRDDAWNRFYIFDVIEESRDGSFKYLPYEEYVPLLEEFNLDYIPLIAKIENPTYEQLTALLDKTDFLLKENSGLGEGIVIKNYDFINKYGRQTWAKIITSEFKAVHNNKTMKKSNKLTVEERIVEDFVTKAFVEKEYAKIVNVKGGWNSKYIPEFLNRVFYTLITEESWNIIKKYKKPIINFNQLFKLVAYKIKDIKKEIF
ncbi:MAG TPA: hypothetical protein ENG48_04355 [Candidatus Atribacteria bacterium]|nr:hypothetical protein [Candidatus Atribacteria bacterium]